MITGINKHICLFLLGSCLILAQSTAFAVEPVSFSVDTQYDVYYEVSEFEVDDVEKVKIPGIVTVGNRKYLVITDTGISRDKQGYILLESVKAILPSHVVPDRTYSK